MRQRKPQIFMSNLALVLSGGTGARMHQDIPKQFLTINDRPVIIHTLECFQRHPEIDAIAVACLEGWENFLEAYAKQFNITKLKHIVRGGDNCQSSSRIGLYELEKHYSPDDIVLIHDGIRPMVSAEIISDCILTTKQYGSAICGVPCTGTMMETEDGFFSKSHYPRQNLRSGQTPNGFILGKICDIHRRALEKGITNSIGSHTLMVELGETVRLYSGSEKNVKLTTVDDIEIFKALLVAKKTEWLK